MEIRNRSVQKFFLGKSKNYSAFESWFPAQDGDEESSEGFDFIMEQLLPSAYTSQAKKYEEYVFHSYSSSSPLPIIIEKTSSNYCKFTLFPQKPWNSFFSQIELVLL